MNKEPREPSSSNNATDKALLDYLEDILANPAPRKKKAAPLSQPASKADKKADKRAEKKVTPLTSARPTPVALPPRPAPPPVAVRQPKPERQTVESLPFRPAEKPAVLLPLNLVTLPPAPEPAPVPESPATPPTTPEKAPPADPVVQADIQPAPDWAKQRFECLVFTVAGLRLAVPLVLLGAIHRIDRKLTALPHQNDWFIGILQTHAAGNIKVLDTALFVMPERYERSQREGLQFVITIHGCHWGLACHEVEKSITLEPDQIKWRTQRGKRPWLAGTVIDQMCALIDTDGFHTLIQNAEESGPG